MIIRCPQCGHTRTVNLSKIPPSSEVATCPRCRHRFRFRTLPKGLSERADPAPVSKKKLEQQKTNTIPAHQGFSPNQEGKKHSSAPAQPRSLTPPPNSPDIWDAMDSLHRQWHEDMERQGHIFPPDTVPVKTASLSMETDTPDVNARVSARSSGVYANPWVAKEQRDVIADSGEDAWEERYAEPPESVPTSELPAPEPPSVAVEPENAALRQAKEEKTTIFTVVQPLKEPPPMSSAGELPDEKEEDALSSAFSDDPPMRAAQEALREAEAEGMPEPHSKEEFPDLPPSPKAEEEPLAHTRFLALDDDMPVEERVERDMRHMNEQEDHAERTLRDLGHLDDSWGLDQNENDGDPVQEEEILWENPAAYGWVRSFMTTVRGAMFNAPSFFSRISRQGSLASGYLFFLLLGCLATVGITIWLQTAARLLPATIRPESFEGASVLLILAPLALGLVQLFIAGGIRLMVLVTAPEKADFVLTFKLVSYAAAPMLLSIVPFVGPAVGCVWFLVALVLGCRHTLGLSWQQAVTAPLPSTLLILGGAAWYYL